MRPLGRRNRSGCDTSGSGTCIRWCSLYSSGAGLFLFQSLVDRSFDSLHCSQHCELHFRAGIPETLLDTQHEAIMKPANPDQALCQCTWDREAQGDLQLRLRPAYFRPVQGSTFILRCKSWRTKTFPSTGRLPSHFPSCASGQTEEIQECEAHRGREHVSKTLRVARYVG